jgi:hypothetical protein
MPTKGQLLCLALASGLAVWSYCVPPLLEIEARLVVFNTKPGLNLTAEMLNERLQNYEVVTSRPVGRGRPLLQKHSTYRALEKWTDAENEWHLIPYGGIRSSGYESHQHRVSYTTDTTRLLAELALIFGGCRLLCALIRPSRKPMPDATPGTSSADS